MKSFILLVFVFTLIQVFVVDTSSQPVEKKILIAPPKNLSALSFGYQDLLASLMWVRLLQDINVCEQDNGEYQGQPEFKESEDVVGEILTRDLGSSRCEFGWAYQMLDSITQLQADFHGAYLDGGSMLSVLVDDRKGAQAIFAKGIQAFPDDWKLLYYAAYHELFEMQNAEKSAELLRRSGDQGAPEWVYALAAKLYTRLGQASFAKTVLEAVLAREPEGEAADRVRIQLQAVDKVLQEENTK